jgi:hypothetical protein
VAARPAAPRSTRRPPTAASGRRSTTPRTARSKTPAGARHGQRQQVRPPGAGRSLAERRSRRALPPGRGRRARAQALQLSRRRAADGAGDRCPRRRRPAPERRGLHARSRPQHHATLVAEVVRMLCAGVVHGDLSEFNILLAAADGGPMCPSSSTCPRPWMPQATTTPSACCCATWPTCATFFGQFAPELLATDYGPEIWTLYQAGLLDTVLTGRYTPRGPDQRAARN